MSIRRATILALACVLPAGCGRLSGIHRDLQSPEWQVRYLAAEQLGDASPNDESIGLLFHALEDPAPRVRQRAADSLVRFLETSGDGILERAAAEPDAVKLVVLGALNSSQEAGRSARVVQVEPLLAMLGSPSADVRLAAAKFLRPCPHPAKRPPLLSAWSNDPDQRVRTAALVAASHPAKAAREDDELVGTCAKLLDIHPELVRDPDILLTLGYLRIRQAAPRVIELVADPELKYLAVESLGLMRATEAVPLLLDLLEKNESWVMNREVCTALGRIRSEAAVPVLAEIFVNSAPDADRDSWDRTLFAVNAMAKIGGDQVFEAFVSQITSKERRDFALYGLHKMTDVRLIKRENYWMYTWEGIAERWRAWWERNSTIMAAKLAKEAAEE